MSVRPCPATASSCTSNGPIGTVVRAKAWSPTAAPAMPTTAGQDEPHQRTTEPGWEVWTAHRLMLSDTPEAPARNAGAPEHRAIDQMS